MCYVSCFVFPFHSFMFPYSFNASCFIFNVSLSAFMFYISCFMFYVSFFTFLCCLCVNFIFQIQYFNFLDRSLLYLIFVGYAISITQLAIAIQIVLDILILLNIINIGNGCRVGLTVSHAFSQVVEHLLSRW